MTLEVVDPWFLDLANVVAAKEGSVQNFGSTKSKGLRDLTGIFTCVVDTKASTLFGQVE